MAEALVTLAETPDDVPGIAPHLRGIAQLTVDRIAAVDYAAVTTAPDGSCAVAASGELVTAVEDASGAGDPVPPPRAAGSGDAPPTMTWPGFPQDAAGMGLRSVSMPLYAGSGARIATLQLYGRDAAEMSVLSAAIQAAENPDLPWPPEGDDRQPLDAGVEELAVGYAEALSVRATIQLALTLLERSGGPGAYPRLRLRAAEDGVLLLTAATTIVSRGLGG
ncbi:hypothetical protein [Actinoplanes teichomyceticus]|uniref:hypothetical protein n=1 Tax=Actinoplanes teichomyceticus TaxID=1867 RepID=UPI000F09F2C7|nr:hypothetical protein [Actinoplanes teichomyceticus]